jgi:hypothetical protein
MNGIGVLRLAILLVLLFADSPVSLAQHGHEQYDDTVDCAVCSFAASAVVLTSQPARIPLAITPAEQVHSTSQLPPDTSGRLAKRTRAPPAHTS